MGLKTRTKERNERQQQQKQERRRKEMNEKQPTSPSTLPPPSPQQQQTKQTTTTTTTKNKQKTTTTKKLQQCCIYLTGVTTAPTRVYVHFTLAGHKMPILIDDWRLGRPEAVRSHVALESCARVDERGRGVREAEAENDEDDKQVRQPHQPVQLLHHRLQCWNGRTRAMRVRRRV